MQDSEKLVNIIKEQAKLFFIDAGALYPFGTCVDKNNNIRPIGAYLEGDDPSPLELIDLLEKNMREGFHNGEYSLGVIAVDVAVTKDDIRCDAIELHFFEPNGAESKRYIQYQLQDDNVEFSEPFDL